MQENSRNLSMNMSLNPNPSLQYLMSEGNFRKCGGICLIHSTGQSFKEDIGEGLNLVYFWGPQCALNP